MSIYSTVLHPVKATKWCGIPPQHEQGSEKAGFCFGKAVSCPKNEACLVTQKTWVQVCAITPDPVFIVHQTQTFPFIVCIYILARPIAWSVSSYTFCCSRPNTINSWVWTLCDNKPCLLAPFLLLSSSQYTTTLKTAVWAMMKIQIRSY